MSKRTDKKGRILKTGESQRPDGRYMYRYSDGFGKRHCIYSADLKTLREKETEIAKLSDRGVDYSNGRVTVLDLIDRYCQIKPANRYHTQRYYVFVRNLIKNESFAARHACDIRVSDAKLWLIKLQKDGRSYSTIVIVRSMVRSAFQLAYDDQILSRNPFIFDIKGLLVNDSVKRSALTIDEQKTFMSFVHGDRVYSKYYDIYALLLHTGIRISELCGLTFNDIDFDLRRIHICKQLLALDDGTLHVEKPKTEHGDRYIPMDADLISCLRHAMTTRPEPDTEPVVDGIQGFLFLTQGPSPKPKTSHHIQYATRRIVKKHNLLCPDSPLPSITPHVFRHTFCTNMVQAGIDAKTLQYLMGHSSVAVTLEIYTHSDFSNVQKRFDDISSSTPFLHQLGVE